MEKVVPEDPIPPALAEELYQATLALLAPFGGGDELMKWRRLQRAVKTIGEAKEARLQPERAVANDTERRS